MVCALGARFLARKLSVADPEEAFMAGLFRHIGLVVLNNQKEKAGDFIISSVSLIGRIWLSVNVICSEPPTPK